MLEVDSIKQKQRPKKEDLMNDKKHKPWGLVLLTLTVSAAGSNAQPIYTPYGFTNLAGSPYYGGTNEGTGSAPLFLDPVGGNLRLQSKSPYIHAGNNTYAPGGLGLFF
jgi:hypothetical protein